jgi:hypothetical protein
VSQFALLRVPLAILGIFLGALVLRVWGTTFGLPFTYHPDEPAHVLQALAVARGLPQGLTFNNPPLYKYLLLGEYIVAFVIGRVGGTFASPQDFVNQFRADPTLLYMIARITSAVLGAALVPVMYALGVRVRGRRMGFLAATFSAITYFLVREAHFAVNDALVTLVTTVGLYSCLRVLDTGTRRAYLLAGAFVGLAFSAKYQGAAMLVPLIIAHFGRTERRWRNLLLSLGASVGAVFVSFPSLFLETDRVLRGISMNVYQGQLGYDGIDPAGGYVFYAKALLGGLGLPLLLAACVGLIVSVVRRERPWLVIASLPLTLYLVMGYEKMYFARYLLPAVPPLLLFAARAVDDLIQIIPRPRLRSAIVILLFVALAMPTLVNSIRFDYISTQTDTRTLARAWIESHLPRGAHIAIDWYPFAPALSPAQFDLLIANGWALYDLSLDEYRERGVEYLVATSFTYDQWVLDHGRDVRRRAFYAQLEQEAAMIVEFRPFVSDEPLAFVYDQLFAPYDHLERLERPGPTVRVYKLLTDGVSR